MVMIGGYKTEDLFQEAQEAEVIMIERCPRDIFIKYLEAGDFFGKPNLDYAFINFGGFGFSTIEALACGLPVISNNIKHFPGKDDELRKIGIDMQTEEKLEEAIIFMNLNFDKYHDCRDIAKKYFDIDYTTSVLINKYRELETKYF
jgi:glycosyltransferase involved in cell wall biosynthesis